MSNKKPPGKSADPWQTLNELIAAYAQAGIDDSWKGEGDPADNDVIKAKLELALARLNSHIEKMRRES